MKRPLLLVCIFLVCICAMVNWGKSPGEKVEREINNFLNPSGEEDFRISEIRISVAGIVAEKADKYFQLKSISIQNKKSENQEVLKLPGMFIIEYPKGEEKEILCGRQIRLEGTFRSFSHATNPGEFDRLDYYEALGIYGSLEDTWFVDCGDKYSRVREKLWTIKKRYTDRLYQVFPPKQAGVLCAILLGEKNETDREIRELYQRNGLIHILSISGMHITLLGMGLYNLLKRVGVPGWVRSICAVTLLIMYGIMTGMSVSSCRAIGMFLIHMLGKSIFRTYDLMTALGVLGLALALKNPSYLHYAGFWLSFLSVAGVGVMFPLLAGGNRQKGVFEAVWSSFLVGVSIMATTLPVQLWFYYEVPYWSLLLNIAVLPCMSILVLSAVPAMCIPGAGLLGTPAGIILWGFEKLCEFSDALHLQPFAPGHPSVMGLVLYYVFWAVVVILLNWLRNAQRRKRKISSSIQIGLWALIVLLGASALLDIYVTGGTTGISVTFLDVGQGDCVVIQTASDSAYVYDCGSMSKKNVGKNILIPYLKSQGIHCLEGVFLSHGDNDHENGLRELLQLSEEEGLQIRYLFLPDRGNKKADFEKILDIYDNQKWKNKPKLEYLAAGMRIEGDGVAMEVLSPPAGVNWDNNASSACLDVVLGKGKKALHILLTGDVDKEGEEYLMNRYRNHELLPPDVLKLAHHGSRNSSSEGFLNEVRPLISVISCGKNNSYGHPHEETLKRLQTIDTKVFRTDRCGAITVSGKGGSIVVTSFLKEAR